MKSYLGTPPRLWLSYVDNTFGLINRTEQDSFFEHISDKDSNIKFTQEKFSDNYYSWTQNKWRSQLSTTVYRKPTHNDHYLQFGSHHPLVHKLGVIRTLHHRGQTVVSDKQEIKDHVKVMMELPLPKLGFWGSQTFQQRLLNPYPIFCMGVSRKELKTSTNRTVLSSSTSSETELHMLKIHHLETRSPMDSSAKDPVVLKPIQGKPSSLFQSNTKASAPRDIKRTPLFMNIPEDRDIFTEKNDGLNVMCEKPSGDE